MRDWALESYILFVYEKLFLCKTNLTKGMGYGKKKQEKNFFKAKKNIYYELNICIKSIYIIKYIKSSNEETRKENH